MNTPLPSRPLGKDDEPVKKTDNVSVVLPSPIKALRPEPERVGNHPVDQDNKPISISESENQWNEFRNSGMLWFINTILHAFGWELQLHKFDGEYTCIPKRTKHRGFEQSRNDRGYMQMAEYFAKNGESIKKDIELDDSISE